MIVSQSEISLIERSRRRQMMLPVERGANNELLACPVAPLTCIGLQPRAFAKSTRVTVLEVEIATLGDLTDDHAVKQGYRSVQGVKEAWARQHGSASDGRLIWIVNFARGDHSKFIASHSERYLSAKRHDTTTDPRRALTTEPAITTAEQTQLALAAAEKREQEQRVILKAERKKMDKALTALEGLDLDEDVFKDLRYIRRRLNRIERELGVAA